MRACARDVDLSVKYGAELARVLSRTLTRVHGSSRPVQKTIALGHSFVATTTGSVKGAEPQIFLPPAVAKLAKGFWRMFAKKPKCLTDDLKLSLTHCLCFFVLKK